MHNAIAHPVVAVRPPSVSCLACNHYIVIEIPVSSQEFVVDVRQLPQTVRATMERGGDHDKAQRRDIMAAVYEQYTKTCRSRCVYKRSCEVSILL